MTVVFVSNYLTLHQIPLCNKLYEVLGSDFSFVATRQMEKERVSMGWQNSCEYPYELSVNDAGVQELIDNADIVLIGSATEALLRNRLHSGRPIIRYSERILKQGRWHVLSPRAIKNVVTQHTVYKNAPIYLLCAGAYAAGDYHLFGAYWNKSYRWGYFPETRTYEPEELKSSKRNSVVQLLWVGRLMKLKHPELAVLAADYLRKKGHNFHLTMIGEGEREQQLHQLVQDKGLAEQVSILGFTKPDKVRNYMEKANIFLFTSDFQEGWGAVLNEAMNGGCAVVASHAIGAAPFLINDNENGCLFKNCDVDDLCQKVESLVADKKRTLELGINAHETITKQWNAETAAMRLIDFMKAIVNGEELPNYKDGPLSKAGFLSNRWYK